MTPLAASAPKYDRLALPRDGQALMQFPPPLAIQVERIMARERARGGWRTTQDILFRIQDPEFLAYWILKSVDPLRLPREGSALEVRLRPVSRWESGAPQGLSVTSRLRLSASGDLMRSPGLALAGERLYEQVADVVFGGDVCFANLESAMTGEGTPELSVTGREAPRVNASRDEYEALVGFRGRRFDVLQLANNHILDYGEAGVRETLTALNADGIQAVGVNLGPQDIPGVCVTHLNGVKIGWVAHTFSVNERPLPTDLPDIVNITPFHVVGNPDIGQVRRQIAAARAHGCDLVVAAMHWGLEFEFYPHPDQISWAHAFADAGADLVIGHHPHVVQPVELYQTTGVRRRVVPILYSLGNLTPPLSHPACVLSAVAHIDLVCGELDGRRYAQVDAVTVVPVAAVGDAGEPRAPILMPLKVALRESVTETLAADLAQMVSYADQIFGPDWRVN